MMEAVAFVILVVVFVFFTVIGMISSRNKTLFTDRIITLSEDGFLSETPLSRSEMKWSIVQKLARTRRYIYIYVAQHSAHVVPRRAFQDASEWDSFYEFCKRKSREV
jgi:YcxB-like protein